MRKNNKRIDKEKAEKILFTSDPHFFHKNIIRFQGRPFKDLNEMHSTIINNWNSVVDEDCIVYCLGDVTFAGKNKTLEILHALKGKIVLIRGNHDRGIDKMASRFEGIYDYLALRNEGVVLFHYPILSWAGVHRDSIHLHGHCHGNLKPVYDKDRNMYTQKRFDVGVDSHNYTPITLNQVYDMADKVENKPIDHHDSERDNNVIS